MKQIWKYIIVALAALSMLACTKEKDNLQADNLQTKETYSYTIAIDPATKSFLDGDHIAWEDGDGVDWCAIIGNSVAKGYSQISSSTPRTFTVNPPFSIDAGGHIYACAQCYGIDYSGGAVFYIPELQNGIASYAMPMVSLPVEIPSRIYSGANTPIATAQFINLASVIEYNVYSSNAAYASENVIGVSFEATDPIAGSFPVDLRTVTEDAVPAPSGLSLDKIYSELTAPEPVGGSKAGGTKVYQVVAPGTWSGTVTVITDAATYVYNVTDKECRRSKIKPLNVDLASSNAIRTAHTSMEALLVSRPWTLASVELNSSSVTQDAGNIIKFNSDHSYTLDCSANSGYVWDYPGGSFTDPDYYGPYGASLEWSVIYDAYAGTYSLGFTDYAFPLVLVDDCTTGTSYEIVTLDDAQLVLKHMNYYNGEEYVITFTGGEEFLESKLAKTWVLSSVMVNGGDWSDSAGDSMTLNLDGSFSFDCSAHNNQVYDYFYKWDWGNPDLSHLGDGNLWEGATLQWSVSEVGGTRYLDFTECAYPLVIVGNCRYDALSYEIVSLTSTSLVLHYSDSNDFTISFTVPVSSESAEALLTAKEWELTELWVEYGGGGTYYNTDVSNVQGNRLTFNANHTLAFDCSANGGFTFDYTDSSLVMPTNVGDMSWSLENNGTTLVFAAWSYPVAIFSDFSVPTYYGIERLDSSELILTGTCYGYPCRIIFTAV